MALYKIRSKMLICSCSGTFPPTPQLSLNDSVPLVFTHRKPCVDLGQKQYNLVKPQMERCAAVN